MCTFGLLGYFIGLPRYDSSWLPSKHKTFDVDERGWADVVYIKNVLCLLGSGVLL